MIEPANGKARNLQALLDGKVDATVSDNDVATLCECTDYTRYCRESLRVENRGLCTAEICFVTLKVHVDICRAKSIMTRRTIESKTDAPMVP